MNLRLIALTIAIFTFAACNDATGQKNAPIKTKSDSLSYAIGAQVAFNIQKDSLDINIPAITEGLKDYLNKDTNTRRIKMDKIIEIFQALSTEMRAKQEKAAESAKTNNLAAEKKFLEDNKKAQGVTTLPSGLQYKVVKMGQGAKPTGSDKVKVHYEGKLLNGQIFDSSIKRGEPAEFPVEGVIPGWTEALKLMPVGSKWILYIPSSLAYGEQGAGGMIGPNETLIFEVELLEVVK